MSNWISEEVQRFLVDNIDSIAELEALLFLREHRDQSWSCSSVAERIYSSEEVTGSLLVKLTNKGLITADGAPPATFRYGSHKHEMARLIDQLAETYAKYLVPVTNLVHKKSHRNIEGIADAFNFKRKK
jgi:hypothetical protein